MNFIQKLQQAMPAHVVPHTPEQMAQVSKEFEQQTSRMAYENHQSSKVQGILGRCGIGKKHKGCKFDNYKTDNQGQRQAYSISKRWVCEFLEGERKNFIFSGSTGTGKNHLACAMANNLMARKHSVLVISVTELMLKIRDKYNKNSAVSEAQFLKYLAEVELLVLDEVGLQRMSDHEAIMLNTIVDSRYTAERPTGVLTNLNTNELNDVLGPRIIERLLENGEWVSFAWESFRKRGKS